MLEAVGDDLVDGALARREVNHLIGVFKIVFAVFQFEEVAHIHDELRRGASAREHGRNDEHHVDKAATERFQVGRLRGVAANALRSRQKPRIHGDGGAIIGKARLVVLIDIVVVEQIEIAVGRLLAIHALDFVAE